MAGIKGMKHKRPRNAKERAVYATARIEQLLDQAREGEIELTPQRLKAIELAYSRLKPTLAAIEQTVVDPRDKTDPAELATRLAAMFDSKPELLDKVLAIRSAAAQKNDQQQSHEHVSH
jgi:chemotaxis protein histidine kinase CheA